MFFSVSLSSSLHVPFVLRPPRPGTPETSKAKPPPSASSHAAQGQIKQGKKSLALEQFDVTSALNTVVITLVSND